MSNAITAAALALLSLTVVTVAQNQTLKFEVASVKPSPPPPPGGTATLGLCHGSDSQLSPFPPNFPFQLPSQGRCVVKSLSLQGIMSVAYPAPAAALAVNDRITGGPGWVSTDRYDIEGKAEDGSATDAQLKAMLGQLLADRFKLRFHTVQKEVKGYSLMVAKGGAKLKPGEGDVQGFFRYGAGNMTTSNASMTALVRQLSIRLKAPVTDQTGLTGGYAFSVPLPSDNDPAAPSIFTVLQEELGLRLESMDLPVDIIVIDHVEKPDAN